MMFQRRFCSLCNALVYFSDSPPFSASCMKCQNYVFMVKVEYQSYYRFDLLPSHCNFIILYYRGYHFKRIQESDSELIREHQWNNGKCKLRKPKARRCILIKVLPKYPRPTKISQDEYKEIGRGPLMLLCVQAYTNTMLDIGQCVEYI
jgi:hypothetical protein